MGEPHGIGIVGLGNISRAYLDTLIGTNDVRIVAVADLDRSRAAAVAAETGAAALSVDELLGDPRVETVLNLTIPAAHAEIALNAIAHGKDVYGEKPYAATLDEGRAIAAAAKAAGRRSGSAPDTILGTGIQTARAAVDDGLIGRPVSATATWVAPGHERWHPNPDFYYRAGGGPLLDMGPYYVTTLVHLLGPIVAVTGRGSRGSHERTIGTGPRAGERIPVEIDTHIMGLLEHTSGALSSLTMSFDAVHTTAPHIEIHGVTGSLALPDPNQFDGETLLWRDPEGQPEALAPTAGFIDAGRGIGLLDLVRSSPGHERASGEMGLHVLEVMLAILDSATSGSRALVSSCVERPPLVPLTPVETWRSHA